MPTIITYINTCRTLSVLLTCTIINCKTMDTEKVIQLILMGNYSELFSLVEGDGIKNTLNTEKQKVLLAEIGNLLPVKELLIPRMIKYTEDPKLLFNENSELDAQARGLMRLLDMFPLELLLENSELAEYARKSRASKERTTEKSIKALLKVLR